MPNQQAIEVILMRQMASYLVTPVFIVDRSAALIFYNQAAERILGRPFDDARASQAGEWPGLVSPTDEAGRPLPEAELAVAIALNERRPARDSIWIRGLDDVRRRIEVTAFPLLGIGERHLGAVAVFWETES